MEILVRDIRSGLTTFRRDTGFTVLVVLTLAAGLGANAAMFSIVDALMLRPLPVQRPDELAQLSLPSPQGPPRTAFSYPIVHALMERRDLTAGVSASTSTAPFATSARGVSEQLRGAWVTGDYFEVLGLQPAAGRLLRSSDDRIGAQPAVVISERLWRRRFGGDRAAVNSTIAIEGVQTTIVGVAPRGFAGIAVGQVADLTLPMGIAPQIRPDRANMVEPGTSSLRVLLRLTPGTTRQQLETALHVAWPSVVDSVMPNTATAAPGRNRLLASRPLLSSGARGWTGLRAQFSTSLFALVAVMAIVLVAVCANVANLVLAKGARRRYEIDLRLALGATRARVVRQFLTEGAMLASLAAAASTVIAWIGARGLLYLLSQGSGQVVALAVGPDTRLLAFIAGLSITATLAFLLLPAIRVAGHRAVRSSNRVREGHTRTGAVLAIAQIAVSVLLLIGAGLFLVTLDNLRTQDLGFRPDHVLLVDVDGPRTGRDRFALVAFYDELLHRTETVPGVEAVSFSMTTPLGDLSVTQRFDVDGVAIGEETPMGIVSPGYFQTLRTPLISGRDFLPNDRLGSPSVAIVNDAFARRYLPGGAIGRRLGIRGVTRQEMEVIGVVKDAPYQNVRSAPPTVFAPFAQRGGRAPITIELAIAGAADAIVRDITRALAPLLPDATVVVRPLTDQIDQGVAQERVVAIVMIILAALVLAVSVVGLYGLFTCIVEQRTAEIGVRIAVGANPRHVLSHILRDAGRLVVTGIGVGVPLAWLAVMPVRSMLFGIVATDTATALTSIAIVSACSVASCFVPARRASRLDPLIALRS